MCVFAIATYFHNSPEAGRDLVVVELHHRALPLFRRTVMLSMSSTRGRDGGSRYSDGNVMSEMRCEFGNERMCEQSERTTKP